jgi:PEP-CTERM motif-containing protein
MKRLFVLVLLFLATATAAKADQEYVWVNGSYTSVSNGYGIGPYGGSLNGTPTQFYCVDFNDEISGNTGWYANVTGLTSSSYSNTLKNSQTFYLEAAWLVTQMMTNSKATDVQIQWAIWYLSLKPSQQNSSFFDYASDLMWDQKAQNAVQNGWTANGWEILTPIGGYGQEFLVPGGPGAATPEPSTIVLLLAGVAAFALLAHKK